MFSSVKISVTSVDPVFNSERHQSFRLTTLGLPAWLWRENKWQRTAEDIDTSVLVRIKRDVARKTCDTLQFIRTTRHTDVQPSFCQPIARSARTFVLNLFSILSSPTVPEKVTERANSLTHLWHQTFPPDVCNRIWCKSLNIWLSHKNQYF